jgi:DNA-binding response OmpR family regulator
MIYKGYKAYIGAQRPLLTNYKWRTKKMTEETILVVDDDHEIVESVKIRLEKEGYTVLCAYDGLEALDVVANTQLSLIIIDVMMPNLDGFSAIMKIREQKNIPIIVMSAKTEDSDKILGLSIGADDYIAKPFNAMELVARAKSQIRRYTQLGDRAKAEQSQLTVVGRLAYDKALRTVYADGQPVNLTATELKIMELFFSKPGKVFSSEEIYESVWQERAYATENTVMVHIRRIREKLELNPKEPEYIKVVWGIGYKLETKKEN